MWEERRLPSPDLLLPEKVWKRAFWLQMKHSTGMDQIHKALRR
jgi:hypothetical protein